MDVGFIGLGIMGAPMAKHLLDGGHSLSVHNRTAAKCQPLQDLGVVRCKSPRDVATDSEVIFLCVSDTPDVESVLFGEGGVVEGVQAGSVVVDCSTISADATIGFAKRLKDKGVDFLDAPLTGGDIGARNGTLTVMVGGEEKVFQRILPLIECFGKLIIHMGPVGSGQRAKMVNQIICALNVLGMAEGLAFAEEHGIDLQKVLQVVSSGAAGSWALDNYAPRILKGDFEPGFPMRLQSKDLRLCMEAIAECTGRFEGTELTDRLFREATQAGLGDKGTQAMFNHLRPQK